MKNKKTFIFSSLLIVVLLFCLSACSTKKDENTRKHQVDIVTSTNIYVNIAKNIVGKHGKVEAVINNGDTDPHDFEPTTGSAKKVANANIVIATGLGYDSWMTNLANANDIHVTKVGEQLMGLKQGDNPHIWYNLDMPKKYVAYLVKKASQIDPKHAPYFKNNAKMYLNKINTIKKLADKIDGQKAKPVYVSEPVFDYALERCHFKIGNHAFEEAVENETDPNAKVVHKMQMDIKQRKIAFFVNNIQASSSTVNNMVNLAKRSDVPVLDVRETMPNGVSYYHWMKSNYQKLFQIFSK
ncbi:zinc ABC transporter substrate-binding protein [Lactobacillus helveticus]|uniref:ABC superfamily ATP binding cassette transporter,binding protein n=1 Tax=Lactobacillus helveticus CIRM-BIA 951 TaxID=1226334 RepID=U6F0K7_LACHE|nr:zinc ABC transporter substrate-binding protein [Lactobacillus helveticus]MDY0990981.1 zinc ABC transporter substrate-binding protein [Lactobacillus helveticus]MDY1001661.1 zinc ABC transporter substrate-binding protein [Lactobacillus helveticus]MEB2873502.1 zinc ABC transporter substrate-binding protein [Lactobacillus helveticus]CDI57607.1 ABC superfamily ATP binding cassette transporter,binding protein [Lactobacillus helveticus CIRM-BIA 951]